MPNKRKKRRWKILLFTLLGLTLLVAAFVAWYVVDTRIEPPAMNTRIVKDFQRTKLGPDHYAVGKNWLRKNSFGIWEMYLEGSPFERGIASGKLSRELIYQQEAAFVEKIREMVPSESYLDFLKYFIQFFNRDIDEYVLPEFQQEIYGISFSVSDEFDFIGTKYERLLNYHAAHDIGHALQDLMLVGCTSFAANMGFADSSLILGRNFDFYINDAFAENKVVCFVNPDKGHSFAFVTWASFIGVVSGMNTRGLTVTINAGKSGIPTKAATPISLLAREILQYASNIDEAIAIAEKRQTFVAESILVGSAADNRAAIIEKSPSRMDVFQVDKPFMVCSNHFQGEEFSQDRDNLEHIIASASAYRQRRNEELLTLMDTITPAEAASILRDKLGIEGESIGIGNEKAMAQMISHHSVIFQPLKQLMWVSSPPYQLGAFTAYQLTDIFSMSTVSPPGKINDTSLTIPPDTFLFSSTYADFLEYRKQRKLVEKAIARQERLPDGYLQNFISLNPGYFEGYTLAGAYYAAIGDREKALAFYRFSLSKEFEKLSQRREVEEQIEELE